MTAPYYNKTSRSIELILLILTILLTLLPFFGLVVLILEALCVAIPAGEWATALPLIGGTLPGIFGFISLIIRFNNIVARKTSKIAAAGILIGLVTFLLILSPGLSGIFNSKDFLLPAFMLFPVVTVGFSLRNIYRELQYKKRSRNMDPTAFPQ